jgi:hypothetical protein
MTKKKQRTANNVSYVMAEEVVNIKVCGSHQYRLGLIVNSSEVRHYAYTKRKASSP